MSILQEFRERKVAAAIAVAGLVAIVIIWLQIRPASLKVNHALFKSVGQIAAAESVKLSAGPACVVAVIDPSHQQKGSVDYEQWEAFRRELKGISPEALVATEVVEPHLSESGRGCSAAEFKQILDRHANVGTIVFLTPLPDWEWIVQKGVPEQVKPRLLVVDTQPSFKRAVYSDYFRHELVVELIGLRTDPAPPSQTPPSTPRAWFDLYYQIYTQQTIDPPSE